MKCKFKWHTPWRDMHLRLQVMPYSTACSTTLSNFEAGQNYKDVSDPAVMVRQRPAHVIVDTMALCY